jgi:hypothetical protein
MTDRQHPITPPPELVQHWYNVAKECKPDYEFDIVTQAARWGADQQLEQDAKWLDTNALFSRNLTILPSGDALRKEMRPKPPSLKEQALEELKHWDDVLGSSTKIIRRALEALPE